MIRFGPAGIPLSCKGRTLRDGISDVHHLGLTAMEVQFIKVNPLTRVVLDEEIGKLPRELVQQLVVAASPAGREYAPPSLASLTNALGRRDSVTTLTWSLAKDYADLQQTKALARALDVDLTLHAPYYVDFFGSAEARARSIRQIQWAVVLAEGLGARLTVTHLGFYGPMDRADSIQELTSIARELSDWTREYSRGTVRLAIEPSGHPDVFGSRDEVLELARRVKGIVPVLNLPHLAARDRLTFDEPEQLAPVVEQFVEASGRELYLNFSGVEFYGPGEFRLTPIKRGRVRFDPLAEVLADRDYDATVISSSPLLEHDAMYMKLLYERALSRRWAKRHQPPPPKPAPAPAAGKPPAKPAAKPAGKPAGKPAARPAARPPPKRPPTGRTGAARRPPRDRRDRAKAKGGSGRAERRRR
ncbi:MAG TPA: TIM barrel protein [Thermoplasmata archaeon]|nr:TIM barrel protein [Thermoplasmata archaeon]